MSLAKIKDPMIGDGMEGARLPVTDPRRQSGDSPLPINHWH
jgi:hypothetical protein